MARSNYKKEAKATHSLVSKYREQSDDQLRFINDLTQKIVNGRTELSKKLTIILYHRFMIIILLAIIVNNTPKVGWILWMAFIIYMVFESINMTRRHKHDK